MAYSKINLTNGTTLNASHLSHYESGIAANDARITTLETSGGVSGEDGLTPFIGENGNWWIGEEDTGVKAQGEDGEKGADGYTPVRGVDYWTEEDKAEIKDSISDPTYTNLLPLSTDTDGSVFNETGYMNGYRFNSTGQIVEKDGAVITGFIPLKKGDIIYCKNLRWLAVNDERYIAVYDADKNFIGTVNGETAMAGTTIDTTNYTVKFETDKIFSTSSVAYVRICFYSNNASWDYTKGIITVNEEIIDSTDKRISNCEERITANEEAISSMNNGEYVPEYIQTEAERVSDLVLDLRNSKSICFAALSDTHVGVGSDTKSAVIDTGKAIKEIRKYLPLDFIGLFGDYVAGGKTSTIAGSKNELKFVHKSLYEAMVGVQQIWMQGNHDVNPYDTDDGDLTDEELYSYIFANNIGTIVDEDSVQRGYGYKDFENQKIRVIYWNSSDISGVDNPTDFIISSTQYEWMANTAFNLSDKEDATEWGIVMMSHMPVNWSDNVTNFVDAYISGTTITIGSFTADFSTTNQAKFLCAINGHTHNYRCSRVGKNEFWQIAVPQVCAGRYNEYGTSWAEVGGELDADGNPIYYYKTQNSATSTSFVVFVIDRKNNKIHAIHYGAGIDRILNIDPVNTITYNLTDCTSNYTETTASSGSSLSMTITPNSNNYDVCRADITVTMGGVDITHSCVSDSTITISNVTSDIVITATVTGYNNVLPLATTEAGGTDIYNGIGYQTGYRISSSGVENEFDGMCCTGFIPVSKDDVINFANVSVKGTNTAYLITYTSDGAYKGYINLTNEIDDYTKEDGTYSIPVTSDTTKYVRFTLGVIDETSIFTINQEIPEWAISSLSTSYTNVVPLSTDTNGTIYNSPYGYQDGYYISSSSGSPGASSEYTVTGFIPYQIRAGATPPTIYIKGATVDSNRIAIYESDKTWIAMTYGGLTSSTLDTDYYKLTPTMNDNGNPKLYDNYGDSDYIRIACKGTGANLIITLNEPIE